MIKTKLKKGDLVRIIAGAKRGNKGLITRLDRRHGRVFVEGVSAIKHVKASQNQQGGINPIDVSIDCSNVMVVNPKNKAQGTRIRYQIKDGKKQRIAVKSKTKLK